MSTKKNKTRPNSARSPKSKGSESLAAEGIYSNPYFMNSVVALVGSAVKVHTASGSVYEGILKTFSPQFDVVVELAHKVDPSNSMHICLDSVVGKMVFKQKGIVKIAILDQDLEYATRDTFQTDTAISKYNGQMGEKELEPWDSTVTPGSDDFELDAGGAANGWDVHDMFRQNEQAFGVTSNFDHGLAGYTTPLQKESKDYKEAEARASKIASEIESSTYYKNRVDLENGDEEEKFAAVVRPSHHNDVNANNGNGAENLSNKYLPPQRRKITTQASKSARTSSSSPPNLAPNQHTHHPQVPAVSTKTPVASATPVVSSHPPVTVQAPQPQQQQPLQHSSSSSSSSSVRERGDQGRERVNGSNPVYESPKPQRVNSSARHGRNYASNESSRSTSNGSMSSPSSTISSASSTTTNHSEPQTPPPQQPPQLQQQPPPPQQQPHHRNPPPGPSAYGAPHSGQVVPSPMIVNPNNDHKVPHNQNATYGMVQNNPNMGNSPAPPQQTDQHHRNVHSGSPFAHANLNSNQPNDYRGAQVHVHSYVQNCGPSNNNAISPSANVTAEPQYIQGPRGAPHYATAHPMQPSGNDHRGHYGHIYTVPMMTSQGGTVVEMRPQPPPPNQGDGSDGPPQMMGPQSQVAQNQIHYSRKPPIVTPHNVVDHSQPGLVQGALSHKTSRRRKEINELKAFGQDFKLADPEEVAAAMASKRSPHGGEDDQQQQMGGGRMHDGPSDLHNPQQGMQRSAPQPKQETSKVVKSNLNPNAKEFVYNPSKQFTPAMSTPSQSRPHTPQTPAAGYAPMPPQAPLGHPMMVPTYVVTTTQPPYPQPLAQQSRFPKVHMGVASQQSSAAMQVAAATGQPLLAPAPLPQFTVPYPPQGYIPQAYQHMLRMVPHGEGMPPVIATINFPGPEAGQQSGPMPFMAAPPPPPPQAQHPQHPPMLHHPQQNNASSPQSNGNNQMAYHRVTPRGW